MYRLLLLVLVAILIFPADQAPEGTRRALQINVDGQVKVHNYNHGNDEHEHDPNEDASVENQRMPRKRTTRRRRVTRRTRKKIKPWRNNKPRGAGDGRSNLKRYRRPTRSTRRRTRRGRSRPRS